MRFCFAKATGQIHLYLAGARLAAVVENLKFRHQAPGN